MIDIYYYFFFFFFQAEDGIRDGTVTGVQTCALPICHRRPPAHGAVPSRPDEGRPGREVMMEVRRLGPQIGAEILGVDVRTLDDTGFARIYRAWLDHNVAVVPGQDLDLDDFVTYSRRFGQVVPHPSKMTRH